MLETVFKLNTIHIYFTYNSYRNIKGEKIKQIKKYTC